MSQDKVSSLGYLARRANGNRSPVVHLHCGSTLLLPDYCRWTVDQLNRYLLYSIDDKPQDRMFEAFLFSSNQMSSGRFLNPMFTGFAEPSNLIDWQEWIDDLFQPDSNLPALAAAVRQADRLCSQVDVWITLPYPEMEQERFGTVDSKNLNFRVGEDRLAAVRWWIENFLRKWQEASLQNEISLRGFRWGRETISDSDLELAQQLASVVHHHGLQYQWLSNYGTNHAIEWDKLGFDLLVLNPNYYGNTIQGWEWIDYTAYFAAVYHCGLQIVCGQGILYSQNHMLDYLNRGLPKFRDYMNQAFLVFSFDQLDLETLYRKDLPTYIKIYAFIKGIYMETPYPGMPYS